MTQKILVNFPSGELDDFDELDDDGLDELDENVGIRTAEYEEEEELDYDEEEY